MVSVAVSEESIVDVRVAFAAEKSSCSLEALAAGSRKASYSSTLSRRTDSSVGSLYSDSRRTFVDVESFVDVEVASEATSMSEALHRRAVELHACACSDCSQSSSHSPRKQHTCHNRGAGRLRARVDYSYANTTQQLF